MDGIRVRCLVGLTAALASLGAEMQAQEQAAGTPMGGVRVPGCCDTGEVPVLPGTRVADAHITIDGAMEEEAWGAAAVATRFTQFEPDEGEPATQRTEARVLYGATALFVFMRAHDTSPGEIASQLTRRDQQSYSDLLGVVIDSYFDRRTAFQFVVNPAGVKQDMYRFDDTSEDTGWDAVWDAATTRDAGGWSAEFRIPYSQLRFRDREEQTWGINFLRHIARREELSAWAPTTRADGGIVSRLGELRGLRDLDPPRRLEVVPYSLASLRRAPGDDADPFHRPTDVLASVGTDVRYGVTSDITLDLTINPDFGQVEADPAQVNLTAFETFLPERRPVLRRGRGHLQLRASPWATGTIPTNRSSTRAGSGVRPRDGRIRGEVSRTVDDRTTILGAWKLSGKNGRRLVDRRAARDDRRGARRCRAGRGVSGSGSPSSRSPTMGS